MGSDATPAGDLTPIEELTYRLTEARKRLATELDSLRELDGVVLQARHGAWHGQIIALERAIDALADVAANMRDELAGHNDPTGSGRKRGHYLSAVRRALGY